MFSNTADVPTHGNSRNLAHTSLYFIYLFIFCGVCSRARAQEGLPECCRLLS